MVLYGAVFRPVLTVPGGALWGCVRPVLTIPGGVPPEPKPAVSRTAPHYIRGQLQLSFCYQRAALSVFVHHAKDLALPDGQEPSAYVKIYLLPDPNKVTKRKTKVVRKNNHPSFMERVRAASAAV